MQGVCQNGDCLNTLGSFKCGCKAGFVLERNRCVGEYEASAPCCTLVYLHPWLPDEKPLLSPVLESRAEQAQCFLIASDTRGCEHPLPTHITQDVCCCTVGKAWGRNCERCPQVGTGESHPMNKLWCRQMVPPVCSLSVSPRCYNTNIQIIFGHDIKQTFT